MQDVIESFNSSRRNEHSFFYIAGNKCDREDRKVTEEEAKEVADQYGVEYFEVSAKTGHNVE